MYRFAPLLPLHSTLAAHLPWLTARTRRHQSKRGAIPSCIMNGQHRQVSARNIRSTTRVNTSTISIPHTATLNTQMRNLKLPGEAGATGQTHVRDVARTSRRRCCRMSQRFVRTSVCIHMLLLPMCNQTKYQRACCHHHRLQLQSRSCPPQKDAPVDIPRNMTHAALCRHRELSAYGSRVLSL